MDIKHREFKASEETALLALYCRFDSRLLEVPVSLEVLKACAARDHARHECGLPAVLLHGEEIPAVLREEGTACPLCAGVDRVDPVAALDREIAALQRQDRERAWNV